MNIDVNFVALIVAVVAAMIIGFVWYGPVFGKAYMKLMGHGGMSKEDIKKAQAEMNKWYAVTAVLLFVTAYVLTHVMALSENFYHYDAVMTGLTSAFWMWLGFIMPVQLSGEIFGGKRWKLFAINTSYQLVVLLVMGLIIALL